jgi:hypothetical protein
MLPVLDTRLILVITNYLLRPTLLPIKALPQNSLRFGNWSHDCKIIIVPNHLSEKQNCTNYVHLESDAG